MCSSVISSKPGCNIEVTKAREELSVQRDEFKPSTMCTLEYMKKRNVTPSNQGHGDPSCASHILETHQHHRHQDLHRHHKNDPTMIFDCALHNLQCATLQLISWRLDHALNQTAVRQSAALIWTPPLIIIVILPSSSSSLSSSSSFL